MTFDNFPVLLQACKQELTAIYENVPGIVFYIAVEPDGEFRFVSVSRDFLTVTGLSREQVVGCLVRDVIPPPSRDMVLNHYREAIRSGQPVRWEEESVYPAGQRYGEVAVTPLYDARGLATHLIGIVHDITERKREERLRLATQAAKMYSFEWDVTTDVVLRSPEHVRVLGVTEPLRVTHHQFVDKIHPDDRPRFIATIAGLTPEKPSGIVTYRLCSSNGALVWLRNSGHAFFDDEGKMLRVIGMVADVTEQKLAEEALRASEERRRLAQQAAGLGMFERNVRTGAITWADGLESLYGLPPGSVDGKTPAFFRDLIHPADRERTAHLIQAALNTGQPTEGEWRAIWPDGSVHWIAARWQALMDDSGEPSRVVGVNMDVTERKLAEKALRESEERFRLAAQAGKMFAYDWDVATDQVVRSGDIASVLGSTGETSLTRQQLLARIHPDDQALFNASVTERTPEHPDVQISYRMLRPDGSVIWLEKIARAFFDEQGRMLRMIGMVADISERKQSEEVRLRHAVIVESSEDAIVSQTLDGIIVSWNAGAQRMYGYTESEAVGKPITFLVPPELLHEENKILERLKAGGRIEQFETVRVTKTGKRTNVSLSISPIKDQSGAIVGCCGIARDITTRKREQEALHESEERLRLAVQAGKMFAYSWDATSDVIERSGESVEILGVNSDQAATGAAIWAMVHPDDKGRLEAALTKLTVQNPMLQITYRITRPDGVIKWLERNGHAYFDTQGKLQRVVGMVADVTERKQAEEALVELNRTLEAQSVLLQSREELLRTFVKNVPVAVAMLDRELRYLQVSDRWCSEHAVEASELLGRPREALPEMPERWKEVNRRALQGETLRADEDSWESAGITRWARWEVRPWRKADGAVGGILVFAEDITRRKQMQEELLGMSRKLIEAQEQERARIGRELHDDINQRLAMLALELQQLEESPSEVQSRVQELRKRTAEISDDVQALSHELHASKLEYLGAVAGMKSWCKEFAERYKVEINFRNDVSSLVPLQLGISLFRVLQEALHNAVKHSGVNRIEVQLREDPGEVHLIVRDLGRGFDIEAARQRRGLGLTSMQERVRLVNGEITIESKPMGGTTIHVTMPLDVEHGAQQLAV